MNFASPTFLFLYLPLVLFVHYALPTLLRNYWLVFVSLFFYCWGDGSHLGLLVSSTAANFLLARQLADTENQRARQGLLAVGLLFNLGLLAYFKYAEFVLGQLYRVFPWQPLLAVHPALPLGISFYTFHGISYVVDVYRRRTAAERSVTRMGLYMLLFPQLLAGPIVRYHQIEDQLEHRNPTWEASAEGLRRFVIGLSKKLLLADTLALYVDHVFALPPAALTPAAAWLGALCFALQLYFDFSGYSDMAIGLAALLGFRFPENFHYPYIAQSVSEYWTRWHLSLTGWFRNYLFFPLTRESSATSSRTSVCFRQLHLDL